MVMHNEEFIDLVDKIQKTKSWSEMDMSNVKFSKVIGVSESTFYRWMRAESPVPLTVVYLLRLMLKDFKGR